VALTKDPRGLLIWLSGLLWRIAQRCCLMHSSRRTMAIINRLYSNHR